MIKRNTRQNGIKQNGLQMQSMKPKAMESREIPCCGLLSEDLVLEPSVLLFPAQTISGVASHSGLPRTERDFLGHRILIAKTGKF